ncbi:aminodeoxychorismate/anthranilate synthase component II [Aliiglaciecola sp. CAU 1673]|uniref:anthranilate synthase component II n=1 Tax=Aliiglaciecola sp. CAU 1673 TaxID=3032595 RepID=UPI0023DCB937|nr:aminodeoxychorismate/anthranilate synthase component II [Aliiglaciecola sp. CAU 1673]MDF2178667.1 aminodeoxychorismate/anthranilate synthase component II [Aliiglaciecola sp. CAU 1673]
MLLLIDNYDSFTHNLARYFSELGQEVKVVRNDALGLEDIERLAPDFLVISPGPCTPDDAGISLSAIAHFRGRIPILGVCLGHQAIGQVLGAKVVRARKVMHGKTSEVHHLAKDLFEGVDLPFVATRYHSLLLCPSSLPQELNVTAWVNDEPGNTSIMGIAHKSMPLWGVQFHPESVLTASGHQILGNYLRLGEQWKKRSMAG